MRHLVLDISSCKLKLLLEVSSFYKCYAKLRQTGARYQIIDSMLGLWKKTEILVSAAACELCERRWISRRREKNSAAHHTWIYFLFICEWSDKLCLFFFFFSNKLKIQKNYGICGYVPEFPSEQRYLLHARKVYQPPKRKAESMAWCQLDAGSIKAKITLFRLLSIKLRWVTSPERNQGPLHQSISSA